MVARTTKLTGLIAAAKYAADIPIIGQGGPSGTGDLLQLKNSAGAILYKVNSAGVPTMPAGALTGAEIAPGTITENLLAASAAFGLGALRVAHAKYDFAVDGGAVSTITPATNAIIPNNAIVLGGIINPTTAFVGATATIGFGTLAGSSASSLKAAATTVATYTIDALLATIPVFTAATAFKMSAAGAITLTIATAALTAGVAEVFVVYFVAAGA